MLLLSILSCSKSICVIVVFSLKASIITFTTSSVILLPETSRCFKVLLFVKN
ncbi:hypothetical protein PQ676_00505 [Rickettsia felis]|uniref:hypothetical protein n=1 Tax=Rickettsia felis TaxID=42862 RepID=UPI0012E06736|nr:hypothetical protein [Rickettsia felis]MDE8610754.1 hypothetical protein [Rickettsia felis]